MELSQTELTRGVGQIIGYCCYNQDAEFRTAALHSLTRLWCHPQAEFHRSCAGHSLPVYLGKKPFSVKQLFWYQNPEHFILEEATVGGPPSWLPQTHPCSVPGAVDNWPPGSSPPPTPFGKECYSLHPW